MEPEFEEKKTTQLKITKIYFILKKAFSVSFKLKVTKCLCVYTVDFS